MCASTAVYVCFDCRLCVLRLPFMCALTAVYVCTRHAVCCIWRCGVLYMVMLCKCILSFHAVVVCGTPITTCCNGPPPLRITPFFSAQDLARLSLRDPEYLSVHEAAVAPTPVKLQQAYMVVEPADKLNTLWSFIRTHLKVSIQARCIHVQLIVCSTLHSCIV